MEGGRAGHGTSICTAVGLAGPVLGLEPRSSAPSTVLFPWHPSLCQLEEERIQPGQPPVPPPLCGPRAGVSFSLPAPRDSESSDLSP